ncbi:MAG: branched-chain amino acid aminotransferase [Bifidobacteriaceae bacterium]|jgi:branched-chain amino acid aminotransferase|nr:branched-chain amino acid aminotransferase [Bifidobacteriaceae bacterium]
MSEKTKNEELDFTNLGFKYRRMPYRFRAYNKDGKWSEGSLETNERILIHEGATVLHYGQAAFEGLRAFLRADGTVGIFRPYENATRFRRSCERLLIPPVSTEMFIDALYQVTKANVDYLPPYGTGASFYLRPYIYGDGENLGVSAAPEYVFSVFVAPIASYYGSDASDGKLAAGKYLISTDYDRAAPHGTGADKIGGNYAASLLPGHLAKSSGYVDVIYLDSATHTKIEELGGANFYGITADNEFVTPASESILPSITKKSVMELAKDAGMKVTEREVFADQLGDFTETGAMGTGAVIAPIGQIDYAGRTFTYGDGIHAGEKTEYLYNTLRKIQFGELQDEKGWILDVKVN